MSKKICTAGTIGSFSFVIIDNEHDVIGAVKDQFVERIKTYTDMKSAETSISKEINNLIGKMYETE